MLNRDIVLKRCAGHGCDNSKFVSRVKVFAHKQTELLEVGLDLAWWAIVDCVAFGEQDYTIKELEYLVRWLMDCRQD